MTDHFNDLLFAFVLGATFVGFCTGFGISVVAAMLIALGIQLTCIVVALVKEHFNG